MRFTVKVETIATCAPFKAGEIVDHWYYNQLLDEEERNSTGNIKWFVRFASKELISYFVMWNCIFEQKSKSISVVWNMKEWDIYSNGIE